MPKITAQELRDKYLNFFKSKGHIIVPSASLIPEADATTLFTGSGMQPMVPFLLGEIHPKGTRIVDSQRCFRSQDIEEVGDNRHTTFFEMLGNWSLGDYFKQEQIPWMFEFLTKELGLDPKHLYVTCFRGNDSLKIPKDEESAKLWQGLFQAKGIDSKIVDFPEKNGMQDGRIFYYDEKKNWWSRVGVPESMPIGEPGGPDSEMFWDFGAEYKLHEKSEYKNEPCHVNCDCGRFIEIGNNVFMEYVKVENGFEKLKQRNVDFGGGLERMLAVLSGQRSVFDTDIFFEMWEVLALDQEVLSNDEIRKARIILDHIRAAVHIVNDGLEPSNKDQGYVLRRLLRRSMVMGKLLNLKYHWLNALVGKVITTYSQAYPELLENSERIFKVIEDEQKKFEQTLEKGLREFQRLIKQRSLSSRPSLSASEGESRDPVLTNELDAGSESGMTQTLTGKEAFDLYQSFGFPWELTKELAEQMGQKVDKAEFETEFKKHQELSRTASAGMFKGGLADHEPKTIRHHTAHHLLLAALRQVLGNHVLQRGSNVSSERLRIDFSHSAKLSPDELKQVEDLVNEKISEDLEVRKEVMPKAEAEKLGAMAEFGTKYGDTVSVYSIFNKDGSAFSREFCGGPHVEHTGIIGKFKIQKEEASSAGVRRIKAVVE